MKNRSAKCEEVRGKLDTLVDSELASNEVESLCGYLEECEEIRQCSECREAIEGIRRLKTLVAASQRVRIPSDLIDRVRRQLEDRPDPREE